MTMTPCSVSWTCLGSACGSGTSALDFWFSLFITWLFFFKLIPPLLLLQFPESYFANEFPTLDFSQCELKLNFRLCVEEINSSFPFSPNSKAC